MSRKKLTWPDEPSNQGNLRKQGLNSKKAEAVTS